jgi:hypothetical protein
VTTILDAARAAYAAGLCLLPTRDDGSKAPDVGSWAPFVSTRATVEEMRAWDFAARSGFGVIAGVVSQSRECWDFDTDDVYRAFTNAASACGLGDVIDRLVAGYLDETPGGGRRIIVEYPADVVWKDETLARRPGRDGEPAIKTLIELPTFAIVAPSNGHTHPSGRPYVRVSGGFDTIATYTAEERDDLIALARTFDQMPRKEAGPRTSSATERIRGDRPGDDYNRRMTWSALLEPAGWTHQYDRGDVSYWCRPGKTHGISASTNLGGADLFYPFTSSTEFEPETSYSKFAVYATLEHRGDFKRAALALSKRGYGVQGEPQPERSPVEPAAASNLNETLAVFRKWLSLDDPLSVIAIAATLVANRAPGDPVWLLVVCAPSTGKTEILSAATRLPWVLSAAKVTEASLLSGTSKRERTTGATGGLLRQIGDFGVLLVKDFTSVLAQNRDSRAEAMAALREVYDGAWDRPVGTDGGRMLSWRGKCGLIGGVTPALDQYGQVVSALGDRFILLRMPDANVDLFGAAALRHGEQEKTMRHELREALAGLVEQADYSRVNRVLVADEGKRLIQLAAYTARARCAVARDGYAQDVQYQPQVEGPGRLVKAYARLLGGLEAIGCDRATAWGTLTRIAVDCAPALRTKVIRALLAQPAWVRTRDIAVATETVTKTASRYLEDLSLLRLAVHTKQSDADNSPDRWEASPWLREYWPEQNWPEPESKTEMYTHAHEHYKKAAETATDSDDATSIHAGVPLHTSQSYPADPEPAWVTTDEAPLLATDSDAPFADHDEPGQVSHSERIWAKSDAQFRKGWK